MAVKNLATAVALSLIVTACDGGNSNQITQTPPSSTSTTPGGIWNGTDSVTGLQVTVLVAEDGDMDAIRSDGAQFYGTLTFEGGNLNATITGITEYGTTFADGSSHGTGTVTGTYAPQSQISAILSFTTASGTSTTSTIKLAFNPAYLTVPNVTNIAGNYTEQSGVVVTISSDGTLFAQDPSTGCVVNGNIHVVTGQYSLYAPLITYASCAGQSALLNGLDFDGLMSVVGSTVTAGLHDKSGLNYGLVYTLTKD